MAASTGIVLAATGIAAANDWYQTANTTENIPWRIVVGGLLLTAFEAGVEKVSEPLAVGLASIMLVTVLVTPFHGNSPVQALANIVNKPQKKV